MRNWLIFDGITEFTELTEFFWEGKGKGISTGKHEADEEEERRRNFSG
jgi:hypothetical protein